MKRIFDFLVAFVLLILLTPLFVILTVVIKVSDWGPALYWSKRVGRNNNIFLMPKFRTMSVNTPQVATHLLEKPESYLIWGGSFIRKTSLDELPQLLSILYGKMSFVGPRPALFNQDDLVELRTKEGVHHLIPGLTGYAQINGRDDISIEEKVKLDKEYLLKKSFLFDLKIIYLTAHQVIIGKNISH